MKRIALHGKTVECEALGFLRTALADRRGRLLKPDAAA